MTILYKDFLAQKGLQDNSESRTLWNRETGVGYIYHPELLAGTLTNDELKQLYAGGTGIGNWGAPSRRDVGYSTTIVYEDKEITAEKHETTPGVNWFIGADEILNSISYSTATPQDIDEIIAQLQKLKKNIFEDGD